MNKGLIMGGIVVIVLVGGLYVANQQFQQAQQTKMTQEKAAMAQKEAMKAKESFDNAQGKDAAMEEKKAMEKTNSAARYVEYSKAAFDQAAGKRRVLYFYATWCPSCKTANEDFTANPNNIPEDVVVIRTNYNDPNTDQEEKDLAKKYGITYQHTFVQVDSKGKEVTKWNGGQTEELAANIK